MASTTLGPTYEPTSTATALAQKYLGPSQQVVDAQTKQAAASTKGLTTLKSAMSAFQTSLASLTGFGKTMFQQSATLSDTTLGSATASSIATPGAYSFFVEQIATASQVSYNNLSDSPATSGILTVKLGGASAFDIDLSPADTDSNGTLTVRELAAAINKAPNNASLVSAAVITVGAVQQLVLTAKNTGAANRISLDTSALPASTWNTNLSTPANINEMVLAKDAIAWLGDQGTGTRVQQASNTFANVDGVKATFTKAQAAGAAPVTVTVGADTSGTIKNVQDFVDTYNKLKAAIDALVDPGDPTTGKAGGLFVHDAGVRALRDSLVKLMRPTGSASLAAYGIVAAKDGSLVLDSARLTRQLGVDPAGLDKLIGSAATPIGIAGSLDTMLKKWNNTVDGQIMKRQAGIDDTQKKLSTRQDALDAQYNVVYQRYLIQFTNLQTLQIRMTSNRDMFDALFGSSSKSN
jgi:flagellar hook-associated protein 2